MSDGRKAPLTHAGLIAHKLAIEAHADVIGEQCSEDGASLETIMALLCYEIASSHCIQQWSSAKLHEFYDFARPEPAEAGPHAVGWRCTAEGVRVGNLALRAQDRVVRGALALQRLHALIGGGTGGGVWTWARPDWLDAFPEMTPENLAKANAAQKAADERRRREAEEARKQREAGLPKLHATPGQRRGRLKNGNPAGDYLAAPRCGATTRARACCRQPAMLNGRCRFHGGLSTGPRTPEGLLRSRTARLVHGARTAEIIDLRAAAARNARRMKLLLATTRQRLAAHASFPHAVGEEPAPDLIRGRDGGLSTNAPAGHGLHRSLSPAPLDEGMNHKDGKTQSDRIARVIPLHPAKTVIARPQAAPESRRTALLASTAAFTRPLPVFAPLRSDPSRPAPRSPRLRVKDDRRSSAFICGSKPSAPQAAPESVPATTPSCHARASGHPGEASGAAPLDPRLCGDDSGEAAIVFAGHGLDRSVSPRRSTATPPRLAASRLTAAPLFPHMGGRRAIG